MADAVCRYLQWDSEFFGVRIAQVNSHRLTPETAAAIEEWCHAEKINCLYFLADSADQITVRLAEDNHFRLVDLRMTLAAKADAPASSQQSDGRAIRPWRTDDMATLQAIARVSHRDSRFYADPHFPRDLCDKLYETWIEKSCHGYAPAVFVADTGDGVQGYATAHRDSDSEGRLGLIAVDAAAQGLGLGQKLTDAVVNWCREKGLVTIRVVTQGRNLRAQKLYARCGFVPVSLQLWYHRWFPDL